MIIYRVCVPHRNHEDDPVGPDLMSFPIVPQSFASAQCRQLDVFQCTNQDFVVSRRWQWSGSINCPIMNSCVFSHFTNDMVQHLALLINYDICTSEHAHEVYESTLLLDRVYKDPYLTCPLLYADCVDMLSHRIRQCRASEHTQEVAVLLDQLMICDE